MLYNLLIQPLVIIFRALYLGINYFAGNLGISLMILSVVMNILLRPFSSWAARIQDKERRIQNILAPQISEIKQSFSGAEQYEELRELYKRYSYNPIYAIRSGLDLFVQLLPLMAAYIMLSELEILKNVSFMGINDLSKPDALLGGFNLLPFVMTAFNVLATLTTKKFTRRERIQAFVIAALFLIMLYNAPSALLIYWTTNNFIMLLKNIINLSAIFGNEKFSRVMNYRFVPEGRKKIFVNALMPVVSVLMTGIFLFYVYHSYGHEAYQRLATIKTLHDIYIFAFIPTFFVMMMVFMKFLAHGFTIRELFVKTFCFAVLTLLVVMYIKLVMFPQKAFGNSKYFMLLLMCYTIFVFILNIRGEKLCTFASRLTNARQNSLFFSSIIFCVIFVCVFYPSMLYLSDPDFFLDSFWNTVAGVSTYGITILFALILIWPLIPELLQNFIAFIAAFLVCMAFINSFVLTESYGRINALQIDERILTLDRAVIRDIISLILTSIIIIICIWKKYIKHLITAFVLISFAMCTVSIYCYFNIRHDNTSEIVEDINFPEYHNRLWRFSKTDKNVICFFLDGFTGDHVIRILEENPELNEIFDGFTYFPDTVATGSNTAFSTPSIYAGHAYSPVVLNNSRPDVKLIEKYADAFSFLPNIFTNKDYDVVLAGTPCLHKDNKYYIENLKHPKSVMTLYNNWQSDYLPHWMEWAKDNNISILKKDNNDIVRFLLVLSLFRTIPFSVRGLVYNHGNWMLEASNQVLRMTLSKTVMPNLAAIQFMDQFVQIDDGKPAFKIIYNHLSHSPCFLQKDSIQLVLDPYPETKGQFIIVDGLFPEHYYTEAHMMKFIAKFLITLKNLDVYDNTRIVLVSDHDFGDSWQLNQDSKWNSTHFDNWPNALLMFKDFDAHGELITSNALMAIGDVPSLLIDGIDNIPGIYTLEDLKTVSNPDRIRINHGQNLSYDENSTLFNLSRGVYQIKGTMFNPANWTRIE